MKHPDNLDTRLFWLYHVTVMASPAIVLAAVMLE